MTLQENDGSTISIASQDTNTTYVIFNNTTSNVAGSNSLIPKPTSGQHNYILTGSGLKVTAPGNLTIESVSDRKVTFTKEDGTIFSIQTQDANTTFADAIKTFKREDGNSFTTTTIQIMGAVITLLMKMELLLLYLHLLKFIMDIFYLDMILMVLLQNLQP